MSRLHVDNVNQKPAAAAEDVFEAIHAVMHLFRAEQYRAVREGPHEFTHLEGKLLGFFSQHPGATLRDLTDHFARDKGQLARLIKSLKAHGLLEARNDEGDRRSLRLHLTAQGRTVQHALRRKTERVARMAVKGLSRTESGELLGLLKRVQGNLKAL